jgi:SAM-dependent methyltransferase
LKLQYSSLLEQYIGSLEALQTSNQAPILDLACGQGRNGLFLIEHDIDVMFADVNSASLEKVKQSASCLNSNQQASAQYWQVDFEQVDMQPLKGKCFSGVIVFRYLHRPLFEQIKAAIKPGGMIIYETFTQQQAQYGRPKNPDFLLKPAELTQLFVDWKIIYHFEGVVNTSEVDNTKQAIAQIIAIKPN